MLLLVIPAEDASDETYVRINSLGAQNGLFVLDVHDEFAEVGYRDVYTNNTHPHYNVYGNKIIRDSLYDFLIKNFFK